MRTLAKFFGYAGGVVVVIVAGQYAYMTSDTPVSGAIWAFLYGFIAIGGLFGPALATRVWAYNKAASVFIWAVALASLTIAISNEVGAMAGRGSEQTAQRSRVADTVSDTRASLEIAIAERKGLKFTPADDAAVQAAKAKVSAATSAKNAECAQRGPKCRDKETAEGEALADLEAITRGKALTDRAAKLDTDITALREKIEHAGPVRETNSQGKAFARLFGLDDAEAAKLSTRQNTAMMVVVELLIVALILAAEEIEKHELPAPAPDLRPVAREAQENEPGGMIEHEAIELPEVPYPALEPVREAPRPLPAPWPETDRSTGTVAPRLHAAARRAAEAAEGAPVPHPFPARPVLVASQDILDGNVAEIVAERIEAGRGKVKVADVFAAYAAECKASGKRPVAAAEFAKAISAFCNEREIDMKNDGRDFFMLRTKLKGAEKKVAGAD